MLKPHIIMARETCAHVGILDAFFKIDGYELISKGDREDTGGGRRGGIMVWKKMFQMLFCCISLILVEVHSTFIYMEK